MVLNARPPGEGLPRRLPSNREVRYGSGNNECKRRTEIPVSLFRFIPGRLIPKRFEDTGIGL